jgi:LysM repeat protein
MKILKISGIVAGIHLLALIVIFANPGCSSSTKPPKPADTQLEAAPIISVPTAAGSTSGDSSTNSIVFNPATATPRYSPTRPGTSVATSVQTQSPADVTPAKTYTVVSGDNLSTIAKKNGVTIAELAAANNLNANTAKLHPNQKLIILGKTPAHVAEAPATTTSAGTAPTGLMAAKPETSTKKTEDLVHTVKPGENLSTIARQYGVKQGEIAVKNNITDPQKIRAGDKLIIPGWSAPVSKNGSKSTSATTADVARHGSDPKPAYPPAEVIDPAAKAAPAEIPVIKVEDAPAPAKP